MNLPKGPDSLCFDKDVFMKGDFDVDQFVADCRKQVQLEEMREDLELYYKLLKTAMVELINKDYADFVNLSTNLVGMDKALNQLSVPLGQLREEVMSLRSCVSEVIQAIDNQLSKQDDLQKKKVCVLRLIQVVRSVEKIEKILHSQNSKESGSLEISSPLLAGQILERIATEFNQLQFHAVQSKGMPLLDKVRPRIAGITSMLQQSLEGLLIEGLQTTNVVIVRHCLRTYATIDKTRDAEALVGQVLVKPYMDQVIVEEVVKSSSNGLQLMYSRLLEFVPHHCRLLREVTGGAISSDKADIVPGYDFLVNSVWPEIIKGIEERLAYLFSPGNPDIFFERYSVSMDFVRRFERQCSSQASVKRLRVHPLYTSFHNKWNLPVYFQLRGGGQRSCFSRMNPFRKRLKLSPSKPQPAASDPIDPAAAAARSLRPPHSGPQLLSHDALLPSPPAPAGGVAEEEEEEGYLLVEEETTDSSLIITMEDSLVEVKAARRRALRKRKRKWTEEEAEERGGTSESEGEEAGVELEIDRQLDQSLETKSKQHNLTTVNVRNIIHEVITNEHVVAMMKAAINETEAVPAFEPKMTRSKFKEVVEKGVVIPAWNISPIKKSSDVNKAPQFVDIPLAEEDSSDEEYRPDEEDEDETAEDTFQESDMESTTSSPRGSRLNRGEEDSCSPWQTSLSRSRRFRTGSVSMGPPPPPKAPPPKAVTDSTFLEKLHAVEEELAVCMEPYQPLSESEDEVGLMAYRTRSKRPLRDIPLGRLEAELRAPDITPDMYDSISAHEDREWTDWLRGLMTSDMDNEEECDDEDDPEYNFLADIDEPDQEDYRDDKAVRITKKEVNELMEELFETLKEDLVGQEVEDEGHEEEDEPQEETHTVQTLTPEEQHSTGPGDEAEDGPITELRTVKQQLALINKRRQLGLQIHTLCNTHTHCPEPYTLKLDRLQRIRLQQQLQQHVQLLTQIHLLSSPVAKLQSEAETTRQFLFELDLLAKRGELLMSSGRPGFCSSFRASNLQGALQLLEELQHTPISHQQQQHRADSRGHVRCYPVMPAELAWLFATRPVFLYPELLPCSSLDPALYCPRRTAAFTAAEDCLLVLGLRNMEGSCDPTKLVSQFLLRKTLVQVRRRILQCCRPGFPDNIIKAFRYQRVLWPMLVACRRVDPAKQRPPVEREESIMPLWLVRSLPVIYPIIKHYNNPSGPTPEALPPCRSGRARQSHLTFLRSASDTYSFPTGTRYPPRLPKQLDFRRIGFLLLQHPLPPPPPDSSPLPDGQVDPPTPVLGPLQVLRRRPLLSRTDTTTSAVSMTTREQIRRHYQTLTSLRRRKNVEEAGTPPPEGPAPSQVEVQEGNDVIRMSNGEEEEEEEEESEVLLALSESSSSSTGSVAPDDDLADPEEAGSGSQQEVTLMPSRAAEEDDDEDKQLEEEEEDQRESEEEVFAQDYLLRVCDAVQVSPGLSEELLKVLDQFSAAGPLGAPEVLYDRLSGMLRPWPQLLRDYAAFLSQRQARRCGLLLEQQLFERSRRFLRQLGRRLGEDSSPYQQVVSALQGNSVPPPEDMDKISSLLNHHPDLQEEFWEFFQQLHAQSSLAATSSANTDANYVSQNPPDGNRKRVERQPSEQSETGSDRKEEEVESERPVCAKNISMTSSGEKVVVWTREADRAILTACQQRGANRKTFRQVSAQLGNKTAQQVSLRFHDLMNLFHSAFQKSTSCSSEGQPISRQEAVLD